MERVRTRLLCGLLVLGLGVSAQSERPWERYLHEVMTAEDVESAAWEETYELLC